MLQKTDYFVILQRKNPWGSRIAAIATDCKSVLGWVRWFESTLPHSHPVISTGAKHFPPVISTGAKHFPPVISTGAKRNGEILKNN